MRLFEFIATAVGSAGIIWHRMPDRRMASDAEIVSVGPMPSSGWRHSACDAEGNIHWPDDPDEVPAWRIERETWARSVGIRLPSYRTRREMEQAQELAEIDTTPVAMPAPHVEVGIDDCADWFASYLREHGAGEYSAAEINDLFAQFCASRGVIPPPIDHVKAALALMPGIHRGKINVMIDGRRQRPVRWLIESASDEDVEAETSERRMAA
jgi:hypothetical protein